MCRRLLVALALAASGCITQELLEPHVEPGGKVTAMLDGAGPITSTALGDQTKDPFSVSGFSPILTFGLVAPAAGTSTLSMANQAVTLALPSGGVQLEIHAAGTGCAASSGLVHLSTDGSSNLDGDFTASGTAPDGSACSFTGTLEGVPVSR